LEGIYWRCGTWWFPRVYFEWFGWAGKDVIT
jgi:hypothetical protein